MVLEFLGRGIARPGISFIVTITATARLRRAGIGARRASVDDAQLGTAGALGAAALRFLRLCPVRPRHRRRNLAQDCMDDPSLQSRADRNGVWVQPLDRRGYTASAAPSNYSDTGYSISSFDVNTPGHRFQAPAMRRWHRHRRIQTVPTAGHRRDARSGQREHQLHRLEEHLYDRYPGGYWNGKFVAVADPAPPPQQRGIPSRPLEPLPYSGQLVRGERDAARRGIAQGLRSCRARLRSGVAARYVRRACPRATARSAGHLLLYCARTCGRASAAGRCYRCKKFVPPIIGRP